MKNLYDIPFKTWRRVAKRVDQSIVAEVLTTILDTKIGRKRNQNYKIPKS